MRAKNKNNEKYSKEHILYIKKRKKCSIECFRNRKSHFTEKQDDV